MFLHNDTMASEAVWTEFDIMMTLMIVALSSLVFRFCSLVTLAHVMNRAIGGVVWEGHEACGMTMLE